MKIQSMAMAVAVLLVQSCSIQSIRVRSEPPGARVVANGVDTSKTTPAEIDLSRSRDDNKIVLHLTDHELTQVELERSFDYWYIPKHLGIGVALASIGILRTGVTSGGEKFTGSAAELIGGATYFGLMMIGGVVFDWLHELDPEEVDVTLAYAAAPSTDHHASTTKKRITHAAPMLSTPVETKEVQTSNLGLVVVEYPAGLIVQEVLNGSATYQAGLQKEDQIVSIAGKPATKLALARLLAVGGTFPVTYRRGDDESTVQLTVPHR